MQKITLLLASLALSGCAHTVTTRSIVPLGLGETTEAHLIERYNDARVNCGTTSQPAFLCNGVIVRGTDYSPTYHSWDNSLNSHRQGAVSFSYLRRDSKYSKLAYGYKNGYIFLPVFYANGKLTPEVLCAFPIDAGTVNRADKGCGATPGIPTSAPCQSQGIYTADVWYRHFATAQGNSARICGFDVRDALNTGATTAFNATIAAMALAKTFTVQNELRLAVWPDGSGLRLPLEAFFYINNSAAGRADAQNDQRDFKNITGISVPVISLWLPVNTAAQATFKYLPADQVITLP